MKFDQKGQAFEPFNLLLGAVFALTVLVIIISAINYFDGLKVDVSTQKLFQGLVSASKQPNKDTFTITQVQFKKDNELGKRAMSLQMGLKEECLQVIDSRAPGFEFDEAFVRPKYDITTNVYARCSTNKDPFVSDCEISCQVSVGRDFDE